MPVDSIRCVGAYEGVAIRAQEHGVGALEFRTADGHALTQVRLVRTDEIHRAVPQAHARDARAVIERVRVEILYRERRTRWVQDIVQQLGSGRS